MNRIDTIDRCAASELHRAPLRPPFNNPPFDPRVRVTLYRAGRVVEIIEGDVERVRRAVRKARQRDRQAARDLKRTARARALAGKAAR